jgi:sulfur-oxidizing protein SoxY
LKKEGAYLMDQQRREVMRFAAVFGLMASVGLIAPAQAEEWSRAAFAEKSLDEVFRVIGANGAETSSALTFTAPEIAENGAVVPVVVSSSLRAEQIAILVEKNPNPLAAQFFFTARTEPFVAARIKMAETSRVYALVKSEGTWTMAVKEIKVTLGGCGG